MTEPDKTFPLLERLVDRLVVLPTAGSTNAEIHQFLGNREDRVVVLTDNQTSGRGRLGRQWVSRPGEALAISLSFPWSGESHTARGSWLPLVVGTCLVEVLRNEGLEGASLKWPNDVMVGEHKLAGILCEYLPPSSMIVGLGINIDFDTTQPPSPRATALAHLLDPMPSLDSLVAGLVTELLEWVGDDHADVAERTRDRVSAVMSTLGRPVEVQEPSGERWRGGARGLDDAGHLLVVPEGSVEPLRVVASDIEHLYQ